ncbi:head GIN domain-containing protein [Erythrobacter sp. SAORIC-644]|uniref:head GIN domain-containing protein n=1 Tax=Erythrobacter sp. SAORIC-644 TaxID=1869314 RepID=UPI001304ED75|nr:head GIN domain-containing protein [Erythrobacter sp. SAORIC-644]
MVRTLTIAALALATVTAIPITPLLAEKTWRSTLDDGRSIGETSTATQRFEKVTLAGNDTVSVTRGNQWRIRASGSPAVVAELRYVVDDGQLVIGRRWRREPIKGTARIEVTAPSVTSATLAGSGNLIVDSMSGSDIGATVAGSGTLEIGRVKASHLSAAIAGSGDLKIAGNAEDSSINIAGSGDIDATRLRVGRSAVSIAGSGGARFRADGPVKASIVGSGSAIVTGTTDCSQTRMGSGRLTCSR